MDLRIVLDTTAGAGRWTSTWLAKRPHHKDYTVVGGVLPLVNESISSVGFAVSDPEISGSIKAFSLHADRRPNGQLGSARADGPSGLGRREGAISLWLRRQHGASAPEIIWAAGEDPSDVSAKLLFDADGNLAFFMENDRYDISIRSELPILDDDWHHIAACWNPATVDLYLDGSLVARSSEFRGMQQGALPELTFGSGPPGPGSFPFRGWMDEIAIWNRSLSAIEVAQQFESVVRIPEP